MVQLEKEKRPKACDRHSGESYLSLAKIKKYLSEIPFPRTEGMPLLPRHYEKLKSWEDSFSLRGTGWDSSLGAKPTYSLLDESNKILLIAEGGFGKTTDHNYEILENLDHFKTLKLPILAGLSRKSMISKALKTSPDGALAGTTGLNTIALTKGANILRVHDVKEAVEAIEIVRFMINT